MKLMADFIGKEVEGGNPSPLGEEKFIMRRYATLQAWSPSQAGLENPPDLDSQILQPRADGTGGDSSLGRSWMGIE
jgi:hypothetical protein